MTPRGVVAAGLWLALAAGLARAAALGAEPGVEAERLRGAKALFFDGRYAEARGAWEAVRAAGGAPAEDAAYWVARCSEHLGEHTRALGEYGAYLERRPANKALAEEARTARVGLAVKLYKSGERAHLPVLHEALRDASRTVRYYAALQLSQLGPTAGAAAIPVLRTIVAQEKDQDLVDRARLALLRLDPKALDERPAETARSAGVRPAIAWVKLRIFEHGRAQPTVSINVPVGLADLMFKSLPDEARDALRRKGYDSDNFWQRLKRLGPTEILTIEGDDGERIQIWTE